MEKEILDKKTKLQIRPEFQKLRAAAEPNILLAVPLREEDLTNKVKKELSEAGVPSSERKAIH